MSLKKMNEPLSVDDTIDINGIIYTATNSNDDNPACSQCILHCQKCVGVDCNTNNIILK